MLPSDVSVHCVLPPAPAIRSYRCERASQARWVERAVRSSIDRRAVVTTTGYTEMGVEPSCCRSIIELFGKVPIARGKKEIESTVYQ